MCDRALWVRRTPDAPLALPIVRKLLLHAAQQRREITSTLWPASPRTADILARLLSSAQASFNLDELLIQLLLPDHLLAPERISQDLHTSLQNLRVLLDATWPADQPMPTMVEHVQDVRVASRPAWVLLDCALWLVTTALTNEHIGAIDVCLYPLAPSEVVLEIRTDVALYPTGSREEARLHSLLAERLAPIGGMLDDQPAPAWLLGWDTGEMMPWRLLLRVPHLAV